LAHAIQQPVGNPRRVDDRRMGLRADRRASDREAAVAKAGYRYVSGS